MVLSPMFHPFGRGLVLPHLQTESNHTINLLDLVFTPEEPIDGKIVISQRQRISLAIQGLLPNSRGEVQRFARDLIIGTSKVGATCYFYQVQVDDAKASGRFEACDIHVDFAFRSDI